MPLSQKLIIKLKDIGFEVRKNYNQDFAIIKMKDHNHTLLISGGEKNFKIKGSFKNSASPTKSIKPYILYKERVNNLTKVKVISKLLALYFSPNLTQLGIQEQISLLEIFSTKRKYFSTTIFKNNLLKYSQDNNLDLNFNFISYYDTIKISSEKYDFYFEIIKDNFQISEAELIKNDKISIIINLKKERDILESTKKVKELIEYLKEYKNQYVKLMS